VENTGSAAWLAYYQQDDASLLENWQRLNPKRVPAQLARTLHEGHGPCPEGFATFGHAIPLVWNFWIPIQGSGMVRAPARRGSAAWLTNAS